MLAKPSNRNEKVAKFGTDRADHDRLLFVNPPSLN
jgi:hypothetical protein